MYVLFQICLVIYLIDFKVIYVVIACVQFLGKYRQIKEGRKEKKRSQQKCLISATKGENLERKDSNLKDLKNTVK